MPALIQIMAKHQTSDRQCWTKDGWIYFTDACVSPFACDQSGIATLPRLSECPTYLWSGRLPSGRLITCKRNRRYMGQLFKTKIQHIRNSYIDTLSFDVVTTTGTVAGYWYCLPRIYIDLTEIILAQWRPLGLVKLVLNYLMQSLQLIWRIGGVGFFCLF